MSNPNPRRRGRPKGFSPAPTNKAASSVRRLLYSRSQAGHALGGLSVSTVIRLEQAKVLTPVKLLPTPNAQTFYRVEQIEALATGRAGR